MEVNDIFEDDDLEDKIYLTDSDGNETAFELLDLLSYLGDEYIVLLSEEEAQKEESSVIILQIVPNPDDPELEAYVPIEDDELVEILFQLFTERNKDIMDFT